MHNKPNEKNPIEGKNKNKRIREKEKIDRTRQGRIGTGLLPGWFGLSSPYR
jgi:hypothetical protein